MAERVLTQRQLNRGLLARQGLLEPFPGSIPRTLGRIGMIQAQYAPAMYVGLWSRMRDFARDDLTRALERRTAIQGTHLRSTIHLVSRTDYWPTVLAIRSTRRAWHVRVTGGPHTEDELVGAADRLRAALADWPMHRQAIDELLGDQKLGGVGLWVDLVRVPPSGTWEHRPADRFALAEQWVGPETGTEAGGTVLLVRRYLQGFGPAAPADIASWAGLPVTIVKDIVAALGLRRFRDESGRLLVDLPRGPLPDAGTPAPVRFLPTWDATLLVHARRTQILPEEHRAKVFSTKRSHSIGTFLVDGAVAGTWRYERGRVETTPFQPLSTVDRREVADEADRLAAFHA